MSLRVHGGEAGGRRLKSPKGIRPTQGVVKEAIFNLLGPLVRGAVVLDLFAGSGALGIEALSRGAAEVTFVELAEACASILRQNLEALGYADRGRTARSEVTRWLASHQAQVRATTLFLLDPPYLDPVLSRTLDVLDGIVPDGATVVVEHDRREELASRRRLQVSTSRRYGDSLVTILRTA